MKRALFLLCAAVTLPLSLEGQTDAQQIERALLAAPQRMRADATIIQLQTEGTTRVLRQGSNGLMCWDNTVRPGFDGQPVDSQCTTEANRPRLEQNLAFEAAGGTEEEIDARFTAAEANGTRVLSEYGSIYYRVMGPTPEAAMTHTTVAVPYATADALRLPERPGPGMLWLMQGGTDSAHLMVAGM